MEAILLVATRGSQITKASLDSGTQLESMLDYPITLPAICIRSRARGSTQRVNIKIEFEDKTASPYAALLDRTQR
jgi:hypothetical protein